MEIDYPDIEYPATETTYQVVGVFGAHNEANQRWVGVGTPSHLKSKAETELEYWREAVPNRRWGLMVGTTTWEVKE